MLLHLDLEGVDHFLVALDYLSVLGVELLHDGKEEFVLELAIGSREWGEILLLMVF